MSEDLYVEHTIIEATGITVITFDPGHGLRISIDGDVTIHQPMGLVEYDGSGESDDD